MGLPRFTQKRTHAELLSYFNREWRSADTPPWGVLAEDPVEVQKAEWLIPHMGSVRSVMDFGCGGGDFLGLLTPRTNIERAVGIDLADKAVERATQSGLYERVVRAHLETAREHFEGKFDLLLFGEVLYYLHDYEKLLTTMIDSFLAPEGIVFIAAAVGRDYFKRRDVERMRGILEQRGMQQLVDDTIDYKYFGVPRRMFLICSQNYKWVLVYQAR